MTHAIVIDKVEDTQTVTQKMIDLPPLAEGDVAVQVAYTTLNYKDALAITGASPVVRSFPMVPGIDLSGIVTESKHPNFANGDRVVLNGWGVGEKHWGGLAETAHLKGDWLVKLPDGISMRQAMAIGTAGYTAMLCVLALEGSGITPDRGEIVVTGAAGGVGSVATALLAAKGYTVAAVTGRPEEETYLRSLGAASIINREELTVKPRALNKERWAGAIDVVGGNVLANVISMISYGGAVAACGLAGGMDLPTTVAPFILRGVTLRGVDSVMRPVADRVEAWNRLATDLDFDKLESMTRDVAFDDVISVAPDFLKGAIRGRIVVPVKPELG